VNAREYERAIDDAGGEELVRLARGIGQVDRAVLRHRLREIWEPRIPVSIAIKIGWPLCSSCARPVVPWQVVRWRFGDWHPTCITAHLSEHGGRHEPGTSSGPVRARQAW